MTIAKKEYLENVRNAWIIAMSAVFLTLVLISSGIITAIGGAMGGSTSVDMGFTITAMRFIAGFLLPIMALMLGFATLAGERESGSLGLLAAQPVARHDILLGKFLGLYGVLATAVLVGIGGGGLIVLTQAADKVASFNTLGTFVFATLVWAGAWISITMLISAFFQRRGTAIAGSLLTWFLFSIVWIPITAIFAATAIADQATSGALEAGAQPTAPGWLIILELLNPDAIYGALLSKTIGGFNGVLGLIFAALLPSQGDVPLLWFALLAWIAAPYAGAYAIFMKRDI